MRHQIITTIFSKEIKEVLRDQKMLFLVILMPFFLYPIMFTIMGKMGASQKEKLINKQVQLWVSPNAEDSPIHDLLQADKSLLLTFKDFTAQELSGVKNTIGLQIHSQDLATPQSEGVTQISLLADQSQDVLKLKSRNISSNLEQLNLNIVYGRLSTIDKEPGFIHPLQLEEVDLAPKQSKSNLLSSLLPLFILLFIFTGCIYIAIDITSGEKERKTLQTLFTTAASAREILLGKFLTVAFVGIVSAGMNLISLLLAMRLQVYLLGKTTSGISLELSPTAWFWFLLLICLTTLLIAALSLAVVLLANTYKEAQSYVSPLMMVFLLPAIMVMIPGLELDLTTAFIPVLNVSLAFIGLLKGSIDMAMLAIVASTSLLYGLMALYLTSLSFGNENVITGQKVNIKQLLLNKN